MQIHKSLSNILPLPLIATAVICLSHMAWGAEWVVTNPLPGNTISGSLGWAIASASAGDTISFSIDTVNLGWQTNINPENAALATFRVDLAAIVGDIGTIFADEIFNCADDNLPLVNINQPSGCCYPQTDTTNPGVCIIRTINTSTWATAGLLEATYVFEEIGSITIDATTQSGWEANAPKIVIDASNNDIEAERHLPAFNIAVDGITIQGFSIINDDRTVADISISEAEQRAGGTTTGPFGVTLINVTGNDNRIETNFIGLRPDGLLPVSPEQYTILADDNLQGAATIGIQTQGAGTVISDNIISTGGYGIEVTSNGAEAADERCGNTITENCLGTLPDCRTSGFNAASIIVESRCTDADSPNTVSNNVSGACNVDFLVRDSELSSTAMTAGWLFDTNFVGVASDGTALDRDPRDNTEYNDERGNFFTEDLCPTVENIASVVPLSATPAVVAAVSEANDTMCINISGENHTVRDNTLSGCFIGMMLNGYGGGNTFSGNPVSNAYWGLMLLGNGSNLITGNTFEDSTFGVFASDITSVGNDGGTNTIDGNTFHNNGTDSQLLAGTILLPLLVFGGVEYNINDAVGLLLYRTGMSDVSRSLQDAQFDITSNLLQGDLLSVSDHLHAFPVSYTSPAGNVSQATCYANDGTLEYYGIVGFATADAATQIEMCALVADPCMEYMLDEEIDGASCDAIIVNFLTFEGQDITPKDPAAWGSGITTNAEQLTTDTTMWSTYNGGGIVGMDTVSQIVINNTFESGGIGIRIGNSTGWRIGAESLEASCQGNTFTGNQDDRIYIEHNGNHTIRCNTFSDIPSDNGFIAFREGEGPRSDIFQRTCMGSSCQDIDQLTAVADISESVIFDIYRVDSDGQTVHSGTSAVSGGFANGIPQDTSNAEATGTTLTDAMNQPDVYKWTYTTTSGTSDYISSLPTTSYDASGGAACSLISNATAASGASSHSTGTDALAGAMVIFLLIISPAAALALVRIRRRRH